MEDKELYVKLGKHIKEQRIRRKLTQEELATFIGVSRNCIANYENGRRFMGVDMLWKLEKFFDCDFKKILKKPI